MVRRVLLAFYFIILVIPSIAQNKRPLTFEDMMKLKRIGDFTVSPDSKWVTFTAVDVSLEANTRKSHLWIVPAKIDGTWTSPQGELTFKQTFQTVSGTLKSGNAVTPINGKLNGDQLSFSAGSVAYSGRVNASSIDGTAGGTKWNAARAGK